VGQPALALFLIAEMIDIRCDDLAVHLIAPSAQTRPQLFFGDNRFVQITATATAVFGRYLRAQQPRLAGFAPGVAIHHALFYPAFIVRFELGCEEFLCRVLQHTEFVVEPGRCVVLEQVGHGCSGRV
jgi:hypothetical protein